MPYSAFPSLLQPRKRVALGRELLANVAVVIGGGDGAADGIVEIVVLVHLVAARIPRRVEMADILNIVADVADNVALNGTRRQNREPTAGRLTDRLS